MRPFYEGSSDRAAEDSIADRFAALRGRRQFRFPVGATVDRVLVDDAGVITALLEIKSRRTPMGMYSDYNVSEERMNLYRLTAARLNLPALLVVQWADRCGYLDVRRAPFQKLAIGGRTDRGDKRDIEPMVHYGLDAFSIAWENGN